MATKAKKGGAAAKTKKHGRGLSRLRKPENMSLEEWQVALRRDFAQSQKFRIKNVGDEPVFSDFEVTNPQSKRTYRVAIRGNAPGENFCSCPDFAVNTLGTCKHIEFALHKLAKQPGAKNAMAIGHRPGYSEVFLHYGARREIVFRPAEDCPASLRTLAGKFFDAENRLEPKAFTKFHEFLHKANGNGAADNGHEVRCYDDALEFIAQARDKEHVVERIMAAFPQGVRSKAFAKLLKVPLYPYQREGALFAAKAGRSLVADDMGLGKTIQAIAAVEILSQTAGVERVLVVAPTSLKHQWSQEIAKFTDRSATVVEGLMAQRSALYAESSFYKVTNYDVIGRDLDAIRRWQPDVIILDEAQRIKNWKTRTAQTVKQLESKHAIVLTGTPLENRLEELHSIVEFVDRFRLGPMFRFLDKHQHADEAGRVVGYCNLSEISKTLEAILIRRTKDKVLQELPERMEKRFFVPMTNEQMDHHEENRATVAKLVQKWRRNHFLAEADQLRMRIALQNMRMSCDSTYLLDKTTDHGVKADELIELLSEVFEDRESKVVVFSQWVRMHELVVRRLAKRKWGHVFFHGGVPGPQRKNLVRQFKEDADCRLFLATDAGGVGLNLQHASAVVNLDQPWNPAVLEQRIGRVHRLGQRRPVRVVDFISQGTIEEGMLNLLAFKKSMFTGVLDGGQNEVFLGGSRLKKFMESVEKASESIPVAMPTEPDSRATNGDGEVASAGSLAASLPPAEQGLTDLLATGLSFLEKLGQTLNANQQHGAGSTSGLPTNLVARDTATGQSYLKLPLPDGDVMKKIVGLLSAFVQQK